MIGSCCSSRGRPGLTVVELPDPAIEEEPDRVVAGAADGPVEGDRADRVEQGRLFAKQSAHSADIAGGAPAPSVPAVARGVQEPLLPVRELPALPALEGPGQLVVHGSPSCVSRSLACRPPRCRRKSATGPESISSA